MFNWLVFSLIDLLLIEDQYLLGAYPYVTAKPR